jgi:putative ABC transport system permease protein
MDRLLQDARHAVRVIAKSPGFALAAILTLGIGIAANTAIFGFMNALLLRPFPLLDSGRLVAAWERHPEAGGPGGPRGGEENPLSVADYRDLSAERPGLAAVAAYRYRDFVVTEAGEPENVPGYLVTPGYFETIGIRTQAGRSFQQDEGTPGSDAVVILSHGFWQRKFGADPAVLDKELALGGRRHRIVGVLPAGLNFPPGAPDVFAPLAFSESEKADRSHLSVLAVARLGDGLGVGQAQAALDAVSARLARQHPVTNAGRTHHLVPLHQTQIGVVTPFLALFQGAAGFVLLIACTNVAGLLIARCGRREREMALRAALGASRGRIVRQLLTEGFILAAPGGLAGVWLAQSGVDLIRASMPADMVRWIAGWTEIRMDGRTLLFAIGLTLLTTLLFGLLPALRASRVDLVEALKAGGRGATGLQRSRLRGALVGFQVMLAFVLISGAALMTRGFRDLVDLYQGFDPGHVVTFRIKLPEARYPESRDAAAFYDRVVGEIASMPGVEAAGIVSHPPADLGPVPRSTFVIEGRTETRPEEKPAADLQTISAGYLPSLRVPVLHGRALDASDGEGAPPVAVVSASLGERFWPAQDPIGRRLRIGDDPEWRTVVGVVGDVKQYWFDRQPRPTLYVSHLQMPRRGMVLFVRSPVATETVVSGVRARVREADPGQPVDEIRTMSTVVAESASFIRLAAALMAILGLAALVLAAVGLYGVMAEHVARRTQEIGIRMALGARSADVLRLVVRQAAWLVGFGLLAGLLGALALGQVMAQALFGIVRPDPLTLLAMMALLAAVALLAAWIPARRATRVDPLQALREE